MKRIFTILAVATVAALGLAAPAVAQTETGPNSQACTDAHVDISENRDAFKAAKAAFDGAVVERDEARQAAKDAREVRDKSRARAAGARKARDDARASGTQALANRDAARLPDNGGEFEGKTDEQWQQIANDRFAQADAKDAFAAEQQDAANEADALATAKQHEADAADQAAKAAVEEGKRLNAELVDLENARDVACAPPSDGGKDETPTEPGDEQPGEDNGGKTPAPKDEQKPDGTTPVTEVENVSSDKGGSLPLTGGPLRLIALVAAGLLAAGGATLGGLRLARR